MNIFPISEEAQQDRISGLHDDLLRHILSFLPTHLAVRTGILSNRWRGVWESLQTLQLNERFVLKLIFWYPEPIKKLLLKCKSLHLSISEFGSIETLLRHCPVVEELVLEGTMGCRMLDFEISMPTLKRLSLNFSRVLTLCCYRFRIIAPALEFLHITDNYSSNYEVGDLPCLKKVEICFGYNCIILADRAMQFLGAVAIARSLSLLPSTMCLLSSARRMNLPTLPNLTHLELQVFHGFGWNLVIDFLRSTPKLEVLILRKNPNICWHCLDSPSWSPQQSAAPPSCLLSSVKVIKIVGFKKRKDEDELLAYLLKYAKVLDRITIDSHELDLEDVKLLIPISRVQITN
ncbi:hypothetical protein NMG60_11037229 [Bertholletia excelsa]